MCHTNTGDYGYVIGRDETGSVKAIRGSCGYQSGKGKQYEGEVKGIGLNHIDTNPASLSGYVLLVKLLKPQVPQFLSIKQS